MAKNFKEIRNKYQEDIAKMRVPGEARQVLDAIYRRTLCDDLLKADMTTAELIISTEVIKQNVSRSVKKLEKMGLIKVINNDYKTTKTITIITNSKNWRVINNDYNPPKKQKVINNDYSKNAGYNDISKKSLFLKTKVKTLYPPLKSPLPEKAKKEKVKTEGLKSAFKVFWHFYPRKRSKLFAEKCWLLIVTDNTMAAKLIEAVLNQKTYVWNPGMLEQGVIPYPATWLNRGNYMDEFSWLPTARGVDGESKRPDHTWKVHRFCWTTCEKEKFDCQYCLKIWGKK